MHWLFLCISSIYFSYGVMAEKADRLGWLSKFGCLTSGSAGLSATPLGEAVPSTIEQTQAQSGPVRSAKYFAPNASLCLARLWSQFQITKVVCPLVKCHRLWQPFPCTPFRHCLQFRVVSNYTQVVLVSCFEWEGWKQSVKPQSGALIVLAK